MLVRELRWSDFDNLREGYYRLYDERAAGEPIGITLFGTRPTYADEVAWFSRLYQGVLAGESVCRVAEVDGHAVGNCVVERLGATPDFETAHVGNLGILVHAPYRGQGVGTALLKETLDACRGTFELVRLSVFSVNVRAIELYRRFGFVPYGRQPAAIRRGDRYFDEDLMILDLRGPSAKH